LHRVYALATFDVMKVYHIDYKSVKLFFSINPTKDKSVEKLLVGK